MIAPKKKNIERTRSIWVNPISRPINYNNAQKRGTERIQVDLEDSFPIRLYSRDGVAGFGCCGIYENGVSGMGCEDACFGVL